MTKFRSGYFPSSFVATGKPCLDTERPDAALKRRSFIVAGIVAGTVAGNVAGTVAGTVAGSQ
ncbi:MAG TPA: hypothetical protein VHW45_18660 [Candidatus Sulfotelmatobacter sp.]|nr:hypothetical protein [Candidatus Sulfotelmatobacter sp.]